MKLMSMIAFLGAVAAGAAYLSRNPNRWRQIRRNMFIGRTFSRLLAGQYLRKLRFMR